jgi:hypothetical protein
MAQVIDDEKKIHEKACAAASAARAGMVNGAAANIFNEF